MEYHAGEMIESNKGDKSAHSDTVYYWMEKCINLLEDYKSLVLKEGLQRTLSKQN